MAKNKITIYQLPADNKLTFASINVFMKNNVKPKANMYNKVYTFEMENKAFKDNGIKKILDYIFQKFNFDHPSDYKGRSLSVSDVIVVEQENFKAAHFVDTFGFKTIKDFF